MRIEIDMAFRPDGPTSGQIVTEHGHTSYDGWLELLSALQAAAGELSHRSAAVERPLPRAES